VTARLSAKGLVRRFPGVLALGGVDLDAGPGEVVALVGENGAGKSTLLKCLAGLEQPDEGSMTYEGGAWAPRSTADAASGGVALVHQELCLAENLSAAENIGLGREPRRGWMPLVDRDVLRERAAHALERVGATFGPDVKVETLAAGQRQLVEIAKGIDQDARVLILDEPTSSLTSRETARLFELVHQLRADDITVLYVSHRLTEILELADRAFVLRDGQNAGHLTRDELTREAMVRMMVGRDLAPPAARAVAGEAAGAPVLELKGLVSDAFPAAAVDLQVRPGELVGLAGLVGAGRTELLETVFGLRPPVSGEVRVEGQPKRFKGPRDAAAAGLALVPEDRKLQGLLLEEGVRVNTALATLDRRSRRGLVDRMAEREVAVAQVDRLGVRTSGIEQVVQTLSGGNQQKVVVGRWLAAEPAILLMDEPTRGVDVGAREELYLLLERLAAEGLAVLFASSDMEELLRLADRVVVLHDGQVTGTLDRSVATEEAVMELATGGGLRAEGSTTT